ncbi:MAG: ATP-binding protein, partial [Bacteroidota bacterium]
ISALILTGDAYKKNNIDSAYKNYAYALKLADRFRLVKFRPKLFFELAMLQCQGYNFEMAVELFDSSKNAALRLGDFATVSNVLNMLGTLQFDLWSAREAKVLFDSSYAMAIKNHLYLQAGVALGNLARFIEDQDSAVVTMKKAVLLITEEGGIKNEAGYIYINIGNRMSNPDSAIIYFEKALQIGNDVPVPEITMVAYNNMAYCYLDKNNPAKASEILQKSAIPIAISDSNYDWLSTLYDTWSDVMAQKHDFHEAWRLQKEARKALVKAEKRKSANQVRLLIMLLEVKNKDLLLSASQIKVATQEDSIKNLKFLVFAMIAMALLIILGSLGVYQRMKIKGHRKELELIRGQIEIEDHERKRIAMQLHDLVGSLDQKMVGQIERFASADLTVRSGLIAEWKKASSLIHSVSYQLNKGMVEDLPFKTLVEAIFEEYREFSNLTLSLVFAPGVEIPKNHLFHLISIIRELLTNAVKYVQEGAVSVTITTEHGNHYVIYQDHGPGFDRNTINQKSMGINNIFERAILMGGQATLQASPGKGTKWIIVIPD